MVSESINLLLGDRTLKEKREKKMKTRITEVYELKGLMSFSEIMSSFRNNESEGTCLPHI